jgi:mRNA interferase MazF
MITSTKNPEWPFDVTIDATRAGLHATSKVRMKLFTLDNRLILRRAGSLSDGDRRTVRNTVQQMLEA